MTRSEAHNILEDAIETLMHVPGGIQGIIEEIQEVSNWLKNPCEHNWVPNAGQIQDFCDKCFVSSDCSCQREA